MWLPTFRGVATVSLLTLAACGDSDASWERSFALDDAVSPMHSVAVAAQWYELNNGRWPTELGQVSDLDDELGQVMRHPPEPVPVPDARAFESVRFEVVSDTLLRVHFALSPFEVPSRGEVEIQDESGPPRTYLPPATSVASSRGVIDIPAYRDPIPEPTALIEQASVRTESGRSYEFADERLPLGAVIFLRPIR